ncbi:hypothetical protein BO79DRAFT_209080 [Aspergillus costaricaensis CBS 115574]|uniref:Uncharacterized protein n=1 Tax=Aspergillus costaricaensis CBS 115574 TaxID=1448317 RepID=A0ACD1IG60_9EURO|nr:hypothetical protein BO79DRAFT_209080 [Aspergillus costaricaensis CBS 115574]RAK89020.1 hypothetical protein BO79DRAFT_209080 [Aspergillus costaricaensis CBS 115574]
MEGSHTEGSIDSPRRQGRSLNRTDSQILSKKERKTFEGRIVPDSWETDAMVRGAATASATKVSD